MSSSTTTLRNSVDTWAGSGAPSSNYADTKRLRVTSTSRYTYLHFNRAFPLGATIVSATLRLYTHGSWGIAPTISVHRVSESWRVKRLTWNNRPTVIGSPATLTQSSAANNHEWAVDVTALLQLVSDGASWFGFRVSSSSGADQRFHSGNAVDYQPVLEVTWSEAPQAPTSLSPSGSRAVGIGKPVLRFDFTDRRGSTALQAVQVQIDPAGNWTTPGFDSGTVAATEPELDLAATAYAGVTAGTETRWRVRVQDGSGLWSDWSDAARFRRDNKGTLTITNPAAAPNDFVSEWTPPIAWSLTGETQKAWQLFVTPADDPTDRLYDTGRTKGTDTSHTLPKAIIEDESDYTVTVRIWDSKDREHTPGDRNYTQATRTFRFAEDATPNPVTGLTATSLVPAPWVQLDFSRSTMPDKLIIKRDDKVIEVVDDPNDLLVSGTAYAYTDRDAAPYKQHTWKVQAVAGGKTSGGPTATLRVEAQGIWLYDHDRDIEVFLAGKDDASLVMGEEGTTHYPMGAKHGVRVTQSLRGYEGPISGVFVTFAGKTAQAWEDAFLAIKERPGRTCTVAMGGEAIRCVVSNMTAAPTPSVPIMKRATFEITQQGRLSFSPRL